MAPLFAPAHHALRFDIGCRSGRNAHAPPRPVRLGEASTVQRDLDFGCEVWIGVHPDLVLLCPVLRACRLRDVLRHFANGFLGVRQF